ncbi:membrane protein insertion efficiency factor YidD [Thiomonas sp.]
MRRLLMLLVRGYQLLLSPWVGGQCRFTPTCSQYTLDALRQHGSARGSYLGMMRIVRCNPWCEGGHDPAPRVFRWAAWRRDELPDDGFDSPAQDAPAAAGKPLKDTVTPPQV